MLRHGCYFAVIFGCLMVESRLPCILSKGSQYVTLRRASKQWTPLLKGNITQVLRSSSKNVEVTINRPAVNYIKYTIQIVPNDKYTKAKNRSSKKNKRKTLCMEITSLPRSTVEKQDSPTVLQLRCSRKYLRKKGSIFVRREDGDADKFTTKYLYIFKGRKTKGNKPKVVPVTCSTWKPYTIRQYRVNGGINVTSCPRDNAFKRMEFGLFNKNVRKMEAPFQTPVKDCWAFFPNITEGTFEATVQLRDCFECSEFALTHDPCPTKRYHSHPLTVVSEIEDLYQNTTDIPYLLKEQIAAQTYNVEIIASTCGSFALLVILFLIFYLYASGKKCRSKKHLTKLNQIEDDIELPIPQMSIPQQKSKKKILVVYKPDNQKHVNAVRSFCELMRLCGQDVLLDGDHPGDVQSEHQFHLCQVVVVVLSKGLVEHYHKLNTNHQGSQITNNNNGPFERTPALVYLQSLFYSRNKPVMFVSFGYGLDNVPEISRIFPGLVENVFSITNEPDVSYSSHHRTKRQLNLQQLLSHLEVDSSLSIRDIQLSDKANTFLYHVSTIMDGDSYSNLNDIAIGENYNFVT